MSIDGQPHSASICCHLKCLWLWWSHCYHILISLPVPIVARSSVVLALHKPAPSSHCTCIADAIFANNYSCSQWQRMPAYAAEHNAMTSSWSWQLLPSSLCWQLWQYQLSSMMIFMITVAIGGVFVCHHHAVAHCRRGCDCNCIVSVSSPLPSSSK